MIPGSGPTLRATSRRKAALRVSLSMRVKWMVPLPRNGERGDDTICQHDRADEAGEAAAGAEVDPGAGFNGSEGNNLGAVGEVAMPDIVERAGRNEIDRLLPLPEQSLVS